MYEDYDVDYEEYGIDPTAISRRSENRPANITEQHFLLLACLDYRKYEMEVAREYGTLKSGRAKKARAMTFRHICRMAERIQDIPTPREYFKAQGINEDELGYINEHIHQDYALEYVLHVQWKCMGQRDNRIKPRLGTKVPRRG